MATYIIYRLFMVLPSMFILSYFLLYFYEKTNEYLNVARREKKKYVCQTIKKMNKALLEIDLGLSEDYKPLINDLLKVATFQIVSHLLGMYTAGKLNQIFNKDWLQNLVFILIGFAVYHLVVAKALAIRYK